MRSGTALAAAVVALVVCTSFAPALHHALIGWDDPGLAARVRGVLGLEAAPDPRLLHAFPILLHLAAALAVLAILRAAAIGPVAAALGTMLFAVHPLQVETVAWAARTPELLGAALGLAALATAGASARARVGSARRVASLVLLALALAVHPVAVAVPLVAIALATGPGARSFRTAVREAAPALALAALAVVWRWASPGPEGAEDVVHGAESVVAVARPRVPALAERLVAAIDAVARLAARVVVPIGLAPSGTPGLAGPGSDPAAWGRALAVAVGLVAAVRFRAARAPLAIFGLGLLPFLGLGIAAPPAAGADPAADRNAYLALLGPALALAGLMERFRPTVARVPAIAALLALAVVTRGQLAFWADDATLAARIVDVAPDSWRGQLLLGDVRAAERKYREAIVAYDAAIAARPDAFEPRFRKGEAWLLLAIPDSAEAAFRGAVEVDPTNARARIHWADMLFASGREPEAGEQIEEAYRLDPRDPMVVHNVAMKRIARGEWDAAEEALEALLALQPGNAGAARTLERLRMGRAAAAADLTGPAAGVDSAAAGSPGAGP